MSLSSLSRGSYWSERDRRRLYSPARWKGVAPLASNCRIIGTPPVMDGPRPPGQLAQGSALEILMRDPPWSCDRVLSAPIGSWMRRGPSRVRSHEDSTMLGALRPGSHRSTNHVRAMGSRDGDRLPLHGITLRTLPRPFGIYSRLRAIGLRAAGFRIIRERKTVIGTIILF